MKPYVNEIKKNFLYENKHQNREFISGDQQEEYDLNFSGYQRKSFPNVSYYYTFPSDSKTIGMRKEINYKIEVTVDVIGDCWLEVSLPEVRVKPEYENDYLIRYARNIGHNIIEGATLKFRNEKTTDYAQSLSGNWLNHYYKLFLDKANYKDYEYLIGNREHLITASRVLPRDKIIVPQPWFYTIENYHALRLYLCTNTDIVHQYRFRTSLSELLQMYKKDENGKYIKIQYDSSVVELNPRQNTDNIPDPILKGHAYVLTDMEKETDQEKIFDYEPTRNLFITDYHYHTIPGGIELGKFHQFYPRTEMSEGVLGIIMSAQNSQLYQYLNYYDVYTTTETRTSESPLESITMTNSSNDVRREASTIDQEFDTFNFSYSKMIPKGMWLYGV